MRTDVSDIQNPFWGSNRRLIIDPDGAGTKQRIASKNTYYSTVGSPRSIRTRRPRHGTILRLVSDSQQRLWSTEGDLNSLAQDFNGTANDVSFTDTFNPAHQLATATITNPLFKFTPSASGTNSYGAVNALNQYPTVTPAGSSVQTIAYGNNGNLTGDGTWTFVYDSENRLMTANATGTAAAYAYDPLGRRTKKTVNSASTFFLQDGDDEVGEYTAAGAIQRRFVPGDTIDEPISMIDYTIAGNPKTYFHTDKQGSTIAMTDASGNLAEGPYKYDGYGNGAPTTGVPFKYTGRRLDPETGLYYYRARYYSASLGRFLQTDPIRYGDDLVMYKYAANDPLNNLDPSGQDFCTTTPPIRCFASPTETVTVYGSSLDADVAFVARMGAISDALEAGMLSRMAAALAEYAPPTAFIVATLYPSTTAGPEGDEYPMGLYNDKVDIDDPESVKGANPEEIAESAKEKGYVESPTRKPGGRRFTSPNGSDQVRIMPGQPGRRSDPVKEGPYAVISKNGKITNVPLAGNPTL